MKKIISFLGIFVSVVLLAGLNPNSANAETWTHTYSYDNIPNRTITYDFISNYNNFLDLTLDDTTYRITSEYKVMDAGCDKFGTVWADLSNDNNLFYLGFYNFELQGQDLNFHIIRNGIIDVYDLDDFALYGYDDKPERYWTLPSVEELSDFLATGEITFNYIPNPDIYPSIQPSSTPVVQPSSTPVVQPSSTPVVQPSSTPVVQPSSTPVVQPSSTPVVQPSSTPVVQPSSNPINPSTPVPTNMSKKKAIVKKSKNSIQITYRGDTSKVITLKKSGTLKYKNKVIKNVKDVAFTKNGTIVYFKKNGDAYYMSSSKVKFLRHKVKSIKKKNNFAISLKLKNDKTVKLKI